MGLSSTTNRVSYAGDGSSTIFSFPYYFFNPSDLKVYLYDVASSVVYAQSLNTNYTVSGNVNLQGVYPSGGNVVMNSAFPSTLQIVVTRSPSPTQNYVLNQNGQINAQALTQQFDYLTTLVQRLQDEVSRSVQMPDGLGTPSTNTSFDPTLPQNTILSSMGGSPLILNSGATGFTYGLVATGSGAVSYLGTLPVVNGGTGQNTPLTAMGVIYALSPTAMGVIPSATTGFVLTSQGSSAPSFQLVSLGSSVQGIAQVGNGGTGTGTSYIQYGVVFASSGTQMANTVAGGGDVPLVGNGGAAPSFKPLNLLSNSSMTGVLPVTFGGTGTGTSYIQFGVLFASSVTQVANTAAGGGDVPFMGNAGAAPSFRPLNLASASSFTGALTVNAGGTGTNANYIQYGLIYASSATQFATVPSAQAGLVMTSNGSSAPSFQSVSLTNSVQAPTTNFNVTSATQVVLAGSGCGTVNLYGTTGQSGKYITVQKTGAGFDSVVVAGSNATINGQTSISLFLQNEAVKLNTDGANWFIENHTIPGTQFNYTPTGNWSGSTVYAGTFTRLGRMMKGNVLVTMSAAPVAVGFSVNLMPGQLTIDSSALLTLSRYDVLGTLVTRQNSGGTLISGCLRYSSNVSVSAISMGSSALPTQMNPLNNAFPWTFGSGDTVELDFNIPVTGWNF